MSLPVYIFILPDVTLPLYKSKDPVLSFEFNKIREAIVLLLVLLAPPIKPKNPVVLFVEMKLFVFNAKGLMIFVVVLIPTNPKLLIVKALFASGGVKFKVVFVKLNKLVELSKTIPYLLPDVFSTKSI